MVSEQERKRSSDYYARNRERILQAKREKRAATNGEQERKQNNNYYARNRDKILQKLREKRVAARDTNDENLGVSASTEHGPSEGRILVERDQNITQHLHVPTGAARKRKRVYCDNTVASTSYGQSANDSELQSDPFDFIYDGIPTEHHKLKRQPDCPHCGAKKFESEVPSFCCMNGKTHLAPLEIPDDLLRLFTSEEEDAKKLRHDVRAYNTDLSFASMGVKVDKTTTNMTSGVYTFRANGAVYHKLDQLIPRDGTPRYLQLYFYDGQEEIELRLRGKSNLERSVIERLRSILANHPYVQTFKHLGELGPLDNYRVSLNASAQLDQRTYNKPKSDEVAAIWVEGNDNISAFNRSIVIYGRQTYPQTIQATDGCYDPLCYSLFFPNGEHGWHDNISRRGVAITNRRPSNRVDDPESSSRRPRNTVSMREYYAYKFQIRKDPNILLLGGRLLQQFGVDRYIKIESWRLNYHQSHQAQIRADLYQGVVDGMNAGETQAGRIGQRTVLMDAIYPSLHIGRSSEYMISRAILSTKNDYVDTINNTMIDRFSGEEQIYYSFDSAEDDHNNNYPTEFLNTLTPGGLPPHLLKLKTRLSIILLRNIDPANGLCNGTRLVCKGFQRNVIDAEIAVGEHAGKRVFLPRIPLCPSDNDMFPFKMKRKQFPIRLSFAMTINKAQGQTIPHVGVYLPEPVFSHGQLYVALSRGMSRMNTKVLIKPVGKVKKPRVYTSNVVYQEVLQDE